MNVHLPASRFVFSISLYLVSESPKLALQSTMRRLIFAVGKKPSNLLDFHFTSFLYERDQSMDEPWPQQQSDDLDDRSPKPLKEDPKLHHSQGFCCLH